MCLCKKSGILYASEDMTVYKVLFRYRNGKFRTPYQWEKVKVGGTLRSRLEPESAIGKDSIGEEGVHAYVTWNRALNHCLNEIPPQVCRDKDGNYPMATILNREVHVLYGRLVVAVCVVPKGTGYYLGTEGDIASGELMINEIKRV